MCDPLTLGLGLQVASVTSGFMAAQAEAKQQNQLYEANKKAANKSATEQFVQNQLAQDQAEQSSAEEKAEVEREARAAAATAKMAAGEANVTGVSVRSLLSEYAGRAGRYRASVDTNNKWRRDQTLLNARGITTGAQNQTNGVRRAAKPSFLDAGLRLAAAGLDTYNDYQDRKKEKGTM